MSTDHQTKIQQAADRVVNKARLYLDAQTPRWRETCLAVLRDAVEEHDRLVASLATAPAIFDDQFGLSL